MASKSSRNPFRKRQTVSAASDISAGVSGSPADPGSQPEPSDGVKPFPVGTKDWVAIDEADVDICFVHGLTGDRDSTWTAPGQSKPWPQAFLPDELAGLRVRIFTYGYDAYPVRWKPASSNRLTHHALDFLQKITSDREKNNAVDRPLILVTHSLGGLVVKQAILKSRGRPEPHLRKLYESVRGVCFLGTPHHGSWMASWSRIPAATLGIFKSTNQSLLKVLETDNELLESLGDDFLALLLYHNKNPETKHEIEVVNFYEEIGYPGVGSIVERSSAIFEGYPPISIHANHAGMVKFSSPADDGFQNVSAQLRRWTKAMR